MAQYIDKAAVENILRNLWQTDNVQNSEQRVYYNKALQEVQCHLDTLEVKGVDLEKEIKLYKMRNPIIGHREESLNDYMSNVAKHFFELGLKAKGRIKICY